MSHFLYYTLTFICITQLTERIINYKTIYFISNKLSNILRTENKIKCLTFNFLGLILFLNKNHYCYLLYNQEKKEFIQLVEF